MLRRLKGHGAQRGVLRESYGNLCATLHQNGDDSALAMPTMTGITGSTPQAAQ